MDNLRYTFGPFGLDPALGELSRDGAPIQVGTRGLTLLRVLLGAHGTPVTKSQLLEAAWPNQIVEEGNLTVQIAALRKILGTAPDGRDWIITVPRLGYRMVVANAIPPATIEGNVPAPLPELPMLAVMPFQNLSSAPEQDYFADGVVEDIITALSRFKTFAVVARNSSFSYKGRAIDVRQVARELGVRYLLEGSIRREGSKLRLAAQLVEGSTGLQLWAQKFDGQVEGVFDFQDRITETVATIVEPQIHVAELERSKQDRPDSIAVYDLFLKARSRYILISAQDNAAAFSMLTQAIAAEPDHAPSLSLAAYLLNQRSVHAWPPLSPDDKGKCLEYARRGLAHANGDAAVLAYCADALLQLVKDYDWAMIVIQSAVEANPNYFLVNFVAGVANLHCGDIGEALHYFERAIRLSPRDPTAYLCMTGIAHAHMVRENFEEALVWAARALTLKPTNPPTLWIMIAANAKLGRMGEAQGLLSVYRKLAPTATVPTIWAGQPQKFVNRCLAILEGLRLAGLPERLEEEVLPSLAVLPFANLSGDPEQDYFADGIVEDIITALSRFKSFAVIAHNSSFGYKGHAVDVRHVAKELGVRYILEGSVRRSGDTLRIAAQLIDGTNGSHLWAQNFDGSLSNVFDFQDRITAAVAIIVEPQIYAAELERSKRERPGSTEVYDLYLRSLPKIFTKTAAGYADTLDLLDKALALEPNNAVVLSLKISILVSLDVMYAEPIGPDYQMRCLELVQRCLQNAAGDSPAMARCSAALIHVIKDYDWGMAVIRTALEINPNNIFVVGTAGIANLHCGDLDDALTYFHRALTLSPRDPVAFWAHTAIAHINMIRGNYIEALSWAARSKALNPTDACNLWMLIAANAHLGRITEAHHHLAELRRVAPGITVARIWAGQPQKYTERCAAILEGLRLAGLE